MANYAYQLTNNSDDLHGAIKVQLCLWASDKVMASHPELPVDKVRLMHREYVVLDNRETCATAFAAVALTLGIIE